jgi:hypothetical protein
VAAGDFPLLPSGIQNAIQEGILEQEFIDGLVSTMAYARFAERETIKAHRGSTVILTRKSEKAATGIPVDPTTITPGDLNNGINPSGFSIEQYQLTMSEYEDGVDVDLVADQAIIANSAIKNAGNLGRQAQRNREMVARGTLFNSYMGGNTIVTSATTPTQTQCSVDDIRGFLQLLVNGKLMPVSSASAQQLQVQEAPMTSGGRTQTLMVTGVEPDGTNVSSNKQAGGISGVLTYTTATNAPVAGDTLTAFNAPVIYRANGRDATYQLGPSDLLNTDLVLDVVANLRDSGIPEFDGGFYACVLDNTSMRQLFSDPAFLAVFQTQYKSAEIRTGRIVDYMGVRFIPTTMAFVQAANGTTPVRVRRPMVLGKECLLQGDFEGLENWAREQSGNGIHDIIMSDGVAHLVRPPLDRLGKTVAMSWMSIFDYACPSDMTATTAVIPTLTNPNAMFKRAAVIEHAG